MTTAVQTPPAVAGKLVVPRDEAMALLRTQLEKGLAVRSLRIRSEQALERAREQKQDWNQVTTALLLKIFDAEGVAEDYNNWVGKILPEYAELSLFIEQFYEEMDYRLKRLHVVFRRVEAEPEVVSRKTGVAAKPPAPPEPPPPPHKPPATHKVTGRKGILIMQTTDNATEQKLMHLATRLGLELEVLQAAEGHGCVRELSKHHDFSFAVLLAGRGESDVLASRQAAFELGYCAGRLRPERICVLHPHESVLGQDEYGIAHLGIDATEGWQFQMGKLWKRAGLEVDMNRLC